MKLRLGVKHGVSVFVLSPENEGEQLQLSKLISDIKGGLPRYEADTQWGEVHHLTLFLVER